MKNSKMLQVVIISILAISIIFLIYGSLFKGGSSNQNKNPNQVDFETIVIDVQGNEYNFIKVDITLDASSDNISSIKSNKEQIRRVLLQTCSNEDGKSLLKPENKEMLKKRIVKNINKNLGINVKKVYFRNFVLAD